MSHYEWLFLGPRRLLFHLQFSKIHEPWPLMKRSVRQVPAFQANSDLFYNLKWILERWILGNGFICMYVPTSIIAFILLPIYPFIAIIFKNPATLKSPIACRLNSWVMNPHQLFHHCSSESLTVRITFVSFSGYLVSWLLNLFDQDLNR